MIVVRWPQGEPLLDLGSPMLTEHVHARYLETTQLKNVPLYQHLGFRTLVEEVEPTSGLRFWTFLREPHGGNRSEGGLSDG